MTSGVFQLKGIALQIGQGNLTIVGENPPLMLGQSIHARAERHLIVDVKHSYGAIDEQGKIITFARLEADRYGKFRFCLVDAAGIGVIESHLLFFLVKNQIQRTCLIGADIKHQTEFSLPADRCKMSGDFPDAAKSGQYDIGIALATKAVILTCYRYITTLRDGR